MKDYFYYGDIIECEFGEQIILKVNDNGFSIHRTSDFLRLKHGLLTSKNETKITHNELKDYLYSCPSLKDKPFSYKGTIRDLPLKINYQTEIKPKRKKKYIRPFNLRD